MKKYFFTFLLLAFGAFSFAQKKYEQHIKESVVKFEKATSIEEYTTLYLEFVELTKENPEKAWKAHYYAAFSQFKIAELYLERKNDTEAATANNLASKFLDFAILKTSAKAPEMKTLKELNIQINDQRKKIL